MANTRDIRRRIKSIRNTAQITKAMQMVAASKMRKAQQQALAGRPYAEQMNAVLARCAAQTDLDAHPLLEKREGRHRGVLLISTDKGLCGGLNTNLLREAAKLDRNQSRIVTLGRKGRQGVVRLGYRPVADFEMCDSPGIAHSKTVSQFLIEEFLRGAIDEVEVLYTEFVSTLTQRPARLQVLPITRFSTRLPGVPGETEVASIPAGEPTFEPSAGVVLSALLPHYVHFQIYQCYLEAKASEQSARMVAMKNATDNALQIVKDLTLQYNKVRQAGITNELQEISTAQLAMA
ncbi:MAG: ATP synthase F1 subunit gamma [Verrucomicrobiae bacterium]|nr:ATP synthase F1 subunit gamma [Verrucomicrobiae bacterium]